MDTRRRVLHTEGVASAEGPQQEHTAESVGLARQRLPACSRGSDGKREGGGRGRSKGLCAWSVFHIPPFCSALSAALVRTLITVVSCCCCELCQDIFIRLTFVELLLPLCFLLVSYLTNQIQILLLIH